MAKTRILLTHQEFRDECLALKDQEAEDMMKVMQKVKSLIDSGRHREDATNTSIQILVQSAPSNPDRIHAFKVLNSLSKQCERFVTVRTIRLDGKEVYVAAGGCGSVSKAAFNNRQVAVKTITLYFQKDHSLTKILFL